MNTEQLRAELLPCPFCGESKNLTVQHCEGTIIHPSYRIYCDNCGASSGYSDRVDPVENWNRRAALHSHDREDVATEATGGDENGGHHLVEPDHETALALADAPRSLRNYVAALRSAITLQSQVKNDTMLFCDLKTDEEKSAFFLSGRGYETGVIALSIQNDVAMAYRRCAEYKKELEDLQSQPSHAGWKEAAIAWEVCASLHREFCKGRDPFFKTRQADFVKHAEDARANALETEALQSQDRADAERYRWIRDEAGLMVLPYDDHGLGPEFPCGSDLDKAIDHARSVDGEGK